VKLIYSKSALIGKPCFEAWNDQLYPTAAMRDELLAEREPSLARSGLESTEGQEVF